MNMGTTNKTTVRTDRTTDIARILVTRIEGQEMIKMAEKMHEWMTQAQEVLTETLRIF